jgi:hypothetical protein
MQRANINGAASPSPKARTQAKAKQTRKIPTRQKLALAVGSVGCFLLALSVFDCTLALNRVAGMPYVLATMMAVGIDVQMVISEMAAIHSAEGSKARGWAESYVHLAVALSFCLNAGAAASHAQGWFILAAIPVGGVIPVFVYIAGRTAGSLWTRK